MRFVRLIAFVCPLFTSVYGQVENRGVKHMGGASFIATNDRSIGTIVDMLAKIDSSGHAVRASTTDIAVPLFIVIGGAGRSGSASLAEGGVHACRTDAAGATAGHFLVASRVIAGRCMDAGASAPRSGWVVGIAQNTVRANAKTNAIPIRGYNSTGGGEFDNDTIIDCGGGTRCVNTARIPDGIPLQQGKWTTAIATGTNHYFWQPPQSVLAVPGEGSMLTATFVNPSTAASTITYGTFGTYKLYRGDQSTQIGNHDFAAGSQHEFRFKQSLDVIPCSAATHASPVVLTCHSHGLTTGMAPHFSGATGAWAPIDGAHVVTVLTPDTFSLAIDSSGFGPLSGSVVAAKGGFWQVDGGGGGSAKITIPNPINLVFGFRSADGGGGSVARSFGADNDTINHSTPIFAGSKVSGFIFGGSGLAAFYYQLGIVPANWNGTVTSKIFETQDPAFTGTSILYYSVGCGIPGTTNFSTALAFGTEIAVASTFNATTALSGKLDTASITPPVACAAGTVMLLRIRRNGGSGGDNQGWNVGVFGGTVNLPYTI